MTTQPATQPATMRRMAKPPMIQKTYRVPVPLYEAAMAKAEEQHGPLDSGARWTPLVRCYAGGLDRAHSAAPHGERLLRRHSGLAGSRCSAGSLSTRDDSTLYPPTGRCAPSSSKGSLRRVNTTCRGDTPSHVLTQRVGTCFCVHMTHPLETLLPSASVCEALSIDRSTLSRWVQIGRITPAIKAPGARGAFFFAPEEVERVKAAPNQRRSQADQCAQVGGEGQGWDSEGGMTTITTSPFLLKRRATTYDLPITVADGKASVTHEDTTYEAHLPLCVRCGEQVDGLAWVAATGICSDCIIGTRIATAWRTSPYLGIGVESAAPSAVES